jgi:hypothetical protein
MANRMGAALDEFETSIKSVVIQKDVLGYLGKSVEAQEKFAKAKELREGQQLN